jgi:hypothetical protein
MLKVMCIYYTNRTDLNYDSQEHIFPAAIGGRMKLPRDYVSKEFNNDISKLERELIQHSIIAMPREIEGPGKRGKLGEKYATKSEIFILNADDPNMVALGYIKQGTGYEIPQVIYNTTTWFGYTRVDNIEDLHVLKENCKNVDFTRLKIIIDNKLPIDKILLGIQKGIEKNHTYFFAKNESNPLTLTEDIIKQLGESIQTEQTPQTHNYQPIFNRKIIFDINHLRIYGKIAFNYLAHKRGINFVLNNQFDPLRIWISKGGENNFAGFSSKDSNPFINTNIKLPDSHHFIYLIKIKDILLAKVFLYNALGIDIILSREFKDTFKSEALICDWKNQKEYELLEYLATFYSGEFNSEI